MHFNGYSVSSFTLVLVLMSRARVDLIVLITKIERYMAKEYKCEHFQDCMLALLILQTEPLLYSAS